MTVSALLLRCYRDYAPLPALVDGEIAYTFAELGDAVYTWQRGLAELGVPYGSRVVLIAGNCAEFAIAEQALFVSGRVRVALSPQLGAHEVADILADCEPSAVLADESTLPTVIAALQTCEHIAPPMLVSLGDTPESPARKVFSFRQVAEAGAAPQAVHTSRRHDFDLRNEHTSTPRPTDLAALLYTSGTTGRAKGAMITHRAWLAMIRNSLVELDAIVPGERFLTVAPMTHLGGYLSLCFSARGCCQVIHRQFDAAAVLRAIEHDQIHHLPLVPTMISMLVRYASNRGGPVDGRSLRSVTYAASPIDEHVLSRAIDLFGPVFVQFFGLSEIPMPITCLPAADHAAAVSDISRRGILASAGRTNLFVDLRIVDRDGSEVTPGTVGEVWAACDTRMIGYWNRPEATAEAIYRGWLRTGDLGYQDDSGYLYLVGRAKDKIITGGFNVYPAEVEGILAADDRVREVAVLGIPDATWGEVVHAAIVPVHAQLTDDDLDSLRAVVRDRLARYKTPRSFSQHTDLPRNGTGKVLRRVLRDEIISATTVGSIVSSTVQGGGSR